MFDALPLAHREAKIEQTRIAKDSGLQYYEYDPSTNEFVLKSLLAK